MSILHVNLYFLVARSSLTSLNLSDNRICGRGAEQVLLASKGTGLVMYYHGNPMPPGPQETRP